MEKESKLLNRTTALVNSINSKVKKGEKVAGIIAVRDGDRWSYCCTGDVDELEDLLTHFIYECDEFKGLAYESLREVEEIEGAE